MRQGLADVDGRLSRLFALRRVAASGAPEEEEGAGIVVRRVWSGSDLPDNGSISLDGRYMAFVDIWVIENLPEAR